MIQRRKPVHAQLAAKYLKKRKTLSFSLREYTNWEQKTQSRTTENHQNLNLEQTNGVWKRAGVIRNELS